MSAQRGKDLLLKVDADGTGTYVTVAGLRSRSLAFNAQTVDITHTESVGHWRELLSGVGVRTARVTGGGVFKDSQSDEIVRAAIFAGDLLSWQIVVPDFGTISGLFQVTAFELTGQHDREITFEIALESAGAINFATL